MTSAITGMIQHLEARRSELAGLAEASLEHSRRSGIEELDPRQRAMLSDLRGIDSRLSELRAENERTGLGTGLLQRLGGGTDAMTYGRQWADQVADKITRAMGHDGEQRAVDSGSIDIPSLIEPDVIPIARPMRLIDMFSNRAHRAEQRA